MRCRFFDLTTDHGGFMRSFIIIFCAAFVLLSLQPEATCMDNVRIFTGADTAHIYGFDGSGIVGEVKNVGFDPGHPDYVDNILEILGDPCDDAHGTCMFGIVFYTETQIY